MTGGEIFGLVVFSILAVFYIYSAGLFCKLIIDHTKTGLDDYVEYSEYDIFLVDTRIITGPAFYVGWCVFYTSAYIAAKLVEYNFAS